MTRSDELNAISIHALREEGDALAIRQDVAGAAISIHALREEGDDGIICEANKNGISIHALREEGDTSQLWLCGELLKFLSTPSARRAT